MEPKGPPDAHDEPDVDDQLPRAPRRPGRWAGRVWIADDFDVTPDWLVEAFEGT
jgi:hypothetical protein